MIYVAGLVLAFAELACFILYLLGDIDVSSVIIIIIIIIIISSSSSSSIIAYRHSISLLVVKTSLCVQDYIIRNALSPSSSLNTSKGGSGSVALVW